MKYKNIFLYIFTIILILLFLSSTFAEIKEIRILHINDFHGFAEPYKPFGSDKYSGGVAFLASKINSLRNEKPSLLLAAGDMIQGNNWANLFYGESVTELMNIMKFDAMVAGNHEFDFGQEILKKRISDVLFPVLGANIEGIDSLQPYTIKNISGIKVGIIGVITEDTPESTHPRNVTGLKFKSVKETVSKYLNEIRDKVDIIILLSHTGYSNDRNLAKQLNGIDLIVGGHSHTKVTNPEKINNTLIVQAWEHGKALGVVDIILEDRKIINSTGYLEEIKPVPGQEDKEVQFIVEKYKKKVDEVLDRTIGIALTDLDGENVRRDETNLGNFIADIIKETAGADAALINAGTIRTGIKKGEIKVKHIYSVLPFNNYIVAIKLTGRQIKEALEHGVSAIERNEGRFPQISGITFKYNPEARPGERVSLINISGRPIDMEKEYSVATNDFLVAGGDGYNVFRKALISSKDFSITDSLIKSKNLAYNEPGKWLRDVVVEYILKKGEVNPVKEGRIISVK
jgi:2',3'-cyclic-nucleotide 2'-phosphodiesterase (5'-nucleotidase family)